MFAGKGDVVGRSEKFLSLPQSGADDFAMELQELSNLLDRIESALDDVEYKLTGLSLMANSNRYAYLVRASKEVAHASSHLMQLEAERISMIAHLAGEFGFSPTASLSEVVASVPAPWNDRFKLVAAALRESLDRVTQLQGEIRYTCQSRIGLFDTALTMIGGNTKLYDASGELADSTSKILSEAL